jgi:hypothetical protein
LPCSSTESRCGSRVCAARPAGQPWTARGSHSSRLAPRIAPLAREPSAPSAACTRTVGRAPGPDNPRSAPASLLHHRAYEQRPRPCLTVGCGASRSREHPGLRSAWCRPASRSQRMRSRAEVVQPANVRCTTRRTRPSPEPWSVQGRAIAGFMPRRHSSRRYWSWSIAAIGDHRVSTATSWPSARGNQRAAPPRPRSRSPWPSTKRQTTPTIRRNAGETGAKSGKTRTPCTWPEAR